MSTVVEKIYLRKQELFYCQVFNAELVHFQGEYPKLFRDIFHVFITPRILKLPSIYWKIVL